MTHFFAALWAEMLKARRSKLPLLTMGGLLILPLVSGLFMFILKDLERAKALGIISIKAQLVGGVADWQTHFEMVKMGTGVGGLILYSIITAWVFGREFSDHTVKELLAIPTPRRHIVGAKFTLTTFWILSLSLLVYLVAIAIGGIVGIPGWSFSLAWQAFWSLALITILISLLMSFVALFASVGRGFLPPLGWAFLSMALAQIAAVMGWGEWFPWAVPSLLSDFSGLATQTVGIHSYLAVVITFLIGTMATFLWWHRADQTG